MLFSCSSRSFRVYLSSCACCRTEDPSADTSSLSEDASSSRASIGRLGAMISDEVEWQPRDNTVFRHEEVGRLWRNPELFESIWVIYYGRYGEVIE